MRRIESRDSLKRGPPLSNVLCESCPLATDAIDIELMSLPNDLPPLRCVSSSIELDGYGVSSVSQLALAGCSVGGRSWAAEGALGILGCLGGEGCGLFCAFSPAGFGDWIGSVRRKEGAVSWMCALHGPRPPICSSAPPSGF
jgi:hypothetical protein